MEPTWPKLVEPLERIVDRMAVVWGAVSHLKAVKDNTDLRSAIEEVQVHIRIICKSIYVCVYSADNMICMLFSFFGFCSRKKWHLSLS